MFETFSHMNAAGPTSSANRVVAMCCAILFAFILVAGSGCGAVHRHETRSIARIFSEPPGSNVFLEDDDPELIRDALPFAMKTYEALLASDPTNRGLCRATAEAFVTYAHVFVRDQAQRLEELDLEGARHLRKRAAKLYLRGRDYALKGLGLDHPMFEMRLRDDPQQALQALSQKDVPVLYWAAAGWAGAISADRSNMGLVAELPIAEAMMRRGLDLDPDFGDGAIHEFFITYEGSRSEMMGGSTQRAQKHFSYVLRLTDGKKASPYVCMAESVAVREQDYVMFKNLLEKALAVDSNAVPKWRMANIVAQDKARWLLDRAPELFIDYQEAEQ